MGKTEAKAEIGLSPGLRRIGRLLAPLAVLTPRWPPFTPSSTRMSGSTCGAADGAIREHPPHRQPLLPIRRKTLSRPSLVFQLLAYLVYRVAGEGGLIAMVVFAVTATFWLLYRLSRRYGGTALAAVMTALAAILASERFSPRPEILSFLFLVLGSGCCGDTRRDAEGGVALCVLILLWVNTEGLFILGYGLLGVALADRPRDRRLWQVLDSRFWPRWPTPTFLRAPCTPSSCSPGQPVAAGLFRDHREFLSPFKDDALHPAVALFPYYLALIGSA